jgi:hypothetical protein
MKAVKVKIFVRHLRDFLTVEDRKKVGLYCLLKTRAAISHFFNRVLRSPNGVHYFPPEIEDYFEKTEEIRISCLIHGN